MAIVFDTDAYVRSHGKRPSDATGPGVWVMEYVSFDAGAAYSTTVFSPTMTYTEARAWARRTAPDWVQRCNVQP